ncbi:hypothetical protein GCM10009733_025570 [Nonomuraea maheshkhaliensis]|uniref:Uncharacterized protein n=1 Tax=Nonomuraea maheshkhaliensis TaxID=419590 RepID=A0ABP4R2T3_9ACTN
MDPQIEIGHLVELPAQLRGDPLYSGHTGEQRLAAVQNHVQTFYSMGARVLGDAPRDLADRLVGHHHRL